MADLKAAGHKNLKLITQLPYNSEDRAHSAEMVLASELAASRLSGYWFELPAVRSYLGLGGTSAPGLSTTRLSPGTSKVKQLEAELAQRSDEIMRRDETIEGLETKIEFLQEETGVSDVKMFVHDRLNREVHTLRLQVDRWIANHGEELRSRRYWERWAKRHGWTSDEVDS